MPGLSSRRSAIRANMDLDKTVVKKTMKEQRITSHRAASKRTLSDKRPTKAGKLDVGELLQSLHKVSKSSSISISGEPPSRSSKYNKHSMDELDADMDDLTQRMSKGSHNTQPTFNFAPDTSSNTMKSRNGKNRGLLKVGRLFESLNALPQLSLVSPNLSDPVEFSALKSKLTNNPKPSFNAPVDPFDLVNSHLAASIAQQPKPQSSAYVRPSKSPSQMKRS